MGKQKTAFILKAAKCSIPLIFRWGGKSNYDHPVESLPHRFDCLFDKCNLLVG